MSQSVTRDAIPFLAAIMRYINAAAGPAAEFSIGVHYNLPGTREKRVRTLRIHRETGTAGILIDKQHSLPMLTTIQCAENTALLLRSSQSPFGANKYNLRVSAINCDASNAAGLVQPHVRPSLAGIN